MGKLIVGLTGNISSGKSTVTHYFKSFGAEVINADKIVHKLYEKNNPLINKLKKIFGKKIINKKGTINRIALGNIVFSDNKKLQNLIRVVWPYVTIEVEKLISKSKKNVVIVEATFLFEAEWHKKVNRTLLVTSHLKSRMERLYNREESFNKKYTHKVVNSQSDKRFRGIKFDYVINNDSTLEDLRKKVEEVWKKLNQIN